VEQTTEQEKLDTEARFKVIFADLSPRRIKEIATAPLFLYSFIKRLLKYGHYEISTPFESAGQQMVYRTFIQLDADIINYLPDFAQLGGNKSGLKTASDFFYEHLQKMQRIFRLYEDNLLALSRAVDSLLALADLYFAVKFFAEQQWPEASFFTILMLLATLAFRIYLKPRLLPWLMKRFYSIIRKILL